MAGTLPLGPARIIGVSSVNDVDREALQRLLGSEEDEQLEFKAELWAQTDAGRRELAADLAALANARGGLIVVGVVEDESHVGRAGAVPGIENPAGLDLTVWIEQVASSISPRPSIAVRLVPIGEGTVAVLIAVAASPALLHTLSHNEALRFPVRAGPHRRFLSESEVVAAYRQRFAFGRDQRDRLAAVAQMGSSLLEQRPDAVWLQVVLVPEQPSDLPMSEELRAAVLEWNNASLHAPPINRQDRNHWARTAFRRVQTGDDAVNVAVYNEFGEWHLDGSASLTTAVGWPLGDRGGRIESFLEIVPLTVLPDEELVLNLMYSLHKVADFAVTHGRCVGGASVEARLRLPSSTTTGVIQPGRHGGHRMATRSINLEESPPPSRTFVDLEESAAPSAGTVLTVRQLAGDLLSAFAIAECRHISYAGVLKVLEFSPGIRERLDSWASEHEVPVERST